MKLTVLKRMSYFLCVIVMMCCTATQAASIQHINYNESTIMPMFVHIQTFNVELEIENGVATCKTMVQSISTSDSINVDINLQQKKSSWNTIKSWNENSKWVIDFSEPWHVVSGYDYRLAVTATVTNSAGSKLETVTKYSSIVSY